MNIVSDTKLCSSVCSKSEVLIYSVWSGVVVERIRPFLLTSLAEVAGFVFCFSCDSHCLAEPTSQIQKFVVANSSRTPVTVTSFDAFLLRKVL